MNEIEQLAQLIRERNNVAIRITNVIGRPAQIGHIGEFIASKVFDIKLEVSAVTKGFDGVFCSGPFRGNTVNIKFYGKLESLLDIREDALPDFYLVLTGPRSKIMTSRGESRPWHIDWVFLFHAPSLLAELRQRNVKMGVATSVLRQSWVNAEIYPKENPLFPLNDDQRQMLKVFHSEGLNPPPVFG